MLWLAWVSDGAAFKRNHIFITVSLYLLFLRLTPVYFSSSHSKGSVETVYKFLEEHNGLSLLDDPLIDVATREILAGKKTRSQIATEIKRKEKAVEKLKYNHRSMELKSEDIHQCLYSIS